MWPRVEYSKGSVHNLELGLGAARACPHSACQMNEIAFSGKNHLQILSYLRLLPIRRNTFSGGTVVSKQEVRVNSEAATKALGKRNLYECVYTALIRLFQTH